MVKGVSPNDQRQGASEPTREQVLSQADRAVQNVAASAINSAPERSMRKDHGLEFIRKLNAFSKDMQNNLGPETTLEVLDAYKNQIKAFRGEMKTLPTHNVDLAFFNATIKLAEQKIQKAEIAKLHPGTNVNNVTNTADKYFKLRDYIEGMAAKGSLERGEYVLCLQRVNEFKGQLGHLEEGIKTYYQSLVRPLELEFHMLELGNIERDINRATQKITQAINAGDLEKAQERIGRFKQVNLANIEVSKSPELLDEIKEALHILTGFASQVVPIFEQYVCLMFELNAVSQQEDAGNAVSKLETQVLDFPSLDGPIPGGLGDTSEQLHIKLKRRLEDLSNNTKENDLPLPAIGEATEPPVKNVTVNNQNKTAPAQEEAPTEASKNTAENAKPASTLKGRVTSFLGAIQSFLKKGYEKFVALVTAVIHTVKSYFSRAFSSKTDETSFSQ